MANELGVQLAVSKVEDLCSPDKMSKAEAKDFLEEVITVLQSSVEALGDEIESEKG